MERSNAPIRKARRKKLLPLQFEQRSMSTQTEDIDITQFLFGAKVHKALKGSTEKKLRQALQIIESYRVKIAIGIEKYLKLKNDLADALKEKKALEKEKTKQEEKYDHKIAKLKDKNYKLKDKLEDKGSEMEKLESKLKKLKEKYDYESDENDDDDDESEDDSDEDSSVHVSHYMCEHKVETIHEYLREFLPPDTTTTDTDTPDEKFEDEELTLKDLGSDDDDDDDQSGSSRSDELEEVIEDMTEERAVLQSRIEELERKLKEKDDENLGLKKTTVIKKSPSETTQTDDDNVSVTTDDDSFLLEADKLTLVSGQESEYSWITKTPSSETVERSSGSEHDDINKRDVNNNVIIYPSGTVRESTEKPMVEKTTVPEHSEKPDVRKTVGSDPDEKSDGRETAEQPVAKEGEDTTGDDVNKEGSNAGQTVKDEPSDNVDDKVQDTKQKPDTPNQGKDNSGKGDVKEDDGKMTCYY